MFAAEGNYVLIGALGRTRTHIGQPDGRRSRGKAQWAAEGAKILNGNAAVTKLFSDQNLVAEWYDGVAGQRRQEAVRGWWQSQARKKAEVSKTTCQTRVQSNLV